MATSADQAVLLASLPRPVFLLGCFLSLIFATIIAYGFYNAFLHPLSKYPGPILWTAYRLPYVIHACKGILPFKISELHRKYGPVVRIAPDEVTFIDPKAFPDLQNRLPDRRQNRKDFVAYGLQFGGTEHQILLAPDANHARIRRIYGPAFTPKALEETTRMLLKYSDQLISALKQRIQTDPCQDMSAFYNYVTFDFTGEFTFDEPFHCLEQGGKQHFYLKSVLVGVLAGFKMAQLERYGIFTLLRPFLPKSVMQAKYDLDDYSGGLVDRRLAKGFIPGKSDLFNYLLSNEEEVGQLTREELIDNGSTLVIAGSDTTSTLLSGTTWHLCTNPDVLKKAASEVRSAFKTDEDITVKAVENLPYLVAVMTEGLRIFPPTPWPWARNILGQEGQIVAGCHVPYKMWAAVCHWAAYHSDTNFARPDDFCPERWLSDPPAEFNNDVRDVLQPFHTGPRGCLGKVLAYAEMRLVMAKMLWHFDMELGNPDDTWFQQQKAYTVWGRTPLMIRLTPVQR